MSPHAEAKTDHDHFNQWSSTYEDSWFQKHLFVRVHKAVLDLAEKGANPATILDVGCGTGRLLREAGKRWPYASRIGVDAAEGMINVARSLAPEVTFHVAMAEALPLPDASVNLVLSTFSFHHWPDQAGGIREVGRVLRPSGCFFLADVAPPLWLMKVFHQSQFQCKENIRNFFKNAGLQVFVQKPVVIHHVLLTSGIKQ